MKKILVNETPWQTRVAIIRENNELQNVYFSPHAHESLERAYYKGYTSAVLPGIQTAFVDIGQEKAGFLHISEIDHEMAAEKMGLFQDSEISPSPSEKTTRMRRTMDISKILKENEPILVQVSKEPIYEKGAKLTTCFTLPGRFIVLMPNIPRIGISKKIESREERNRLRDILTRKLPVGMGAIVRTSSELISEAAIEKDIAFLVHTWKSILKKFAKAKIKERLYQDLDLALAIIRDNLDDDVTEIIVDDPHIQQRIYRFVKNNAPDHVHKIKIYNGPPALFDKYNIESQIEDALKHKVPLPSGGSLIIEATEAMTVVDVNTGRFTGKSSLEETIFKTNLEAAEQVVQQLRLRNIGGLIVIDFIDMIKPVNRQRLFNHFEKMLKERDKFQSVVLKVSEFGLVQMTRKRSGKTLIQQLTENCSCCNGLGFVRSLQSEAYTILQRIIDTLHYSKNTTSISLFVHPDVFEYIVSTEYNALIGLEKMYNRKITLNSADYLEIHEYEIK